MIDNYHFGSITIDGKNYNYDVEVYSDGRVLKWWRKEGHVVNIEDIERSLEQNPEIIIIGTGESGVVKVKEEVKKEILTKGIELIIDLTGGAVKIFNELSQKYPNKKIIGLFHLTC